jgi:O-antigen/teichoic acid export membrane protein
MNLFEINYLIYSFVFAYLLSLVYIYKVEKLSITIDKKLIKLKYIKRIILIGFPVFFLGFVKLLSSSLDRIFIAYNLGMESVGLYSFSFLFAMVMGVFGGIFISVISPYIMSNNEEYDSIKIAKYIYILFIGSGIMMITLFNFYTIVLYYGDFIEKFRGGYWITFILFLTTYNMMMIQFFALALFKNNNYKYLFYYSLFLLIFLFIGNIVITLFKLDLIEYSISTLIISFVFLMIILYSFCERLNFKNFLFKKIMLLFGIYIGMYFLRFIDIYGV